MFHAMLTGMLIGLAIYVIFRPLAELGRSGSTDWDDQPTRWLSEDELFRDD